MNRNGVPFEHPWEEKPLGLVGNVEVGGTPSTFVPRFWGGNIPWMASGDVHNKMITDVPGRITEEGLRYSNAKLIEPPTVAVALAGQGKTRGTVALTLITICTNQSVALVKGTEGLLETRYLYHALDFRYEELRARSAGGGRAGLSKRIIDAVPIPLPLYEEQRRIAEILDAADEAIRKTDELIAKLKMMKQGLLHDLLTRGVDEEGRLREPEAHLEQFRESELGLVPSTWEIEPLIRVATLQRGMDLPIDERIPGSVPVYGSNGIDGWHNVSPLSGPGVITGRSGSIGFVYYSEGIYWPLNTTLYVKDFYNNIPTFVKLLLEYLRLERFTAATGVPSLNRNFVHPIKVCIPGPAEQKGIVEIVSAHDARIKAEEAYRDKLKMIKKGLIHDLLTGRVRVKV